MRLARARYHEVALTDPEDCGRDVSTSPPRAKGTRRITVAGVLRRVPSLGCTAARISAEAAAVYNA